MVQSKKSGKSIRIVSEIQTDVLKVTNAKPQYSGLHYLTTKLGARSSEEKEIRVKNAGLRALPICPAACFVRGAWSARDNSAADSTGCLYCLWCRWPLLRSRGRAGSNVVLLWEPGVGLWAQCCSGLLYGR